MERSSLINFLGIVLLFATPLSANSQIQELKSAQDKRKEYISRSSTSAKRKQVVESKCFYVNPFIGTGGHGHTYPGASAPFGMIQLSPDTRFDGWDGCSGYHYSDSIIYGFSHTHLSGTGVSDYGDLLIVPQSGSPKTEPGYLVDGGYGASFSHKSETALPGMYSVKLESENIDVRLAVTERAGMHEYIFNNQDEEHSILIDLDHRDRVIDAGIEVVGENTVNGYRISESWASEQHFYFYMESNVAFESAKKISDKGKNKLLLTFSPTTKKVLLKVGISAVDEEGAKENLLVEIPSWSFNIVQKSTKSLWEKELNKIDFKTENRDLKTTFYTSLYHSFLAPNIFHDVDGRYRGRDLEKHKLNPEESSNYTVFSLWDTYRGTHPLFTFTQGKRVNEFVQTFIRQYEQGGDLPVWELAANETECMIGYHSVSVIADAAVKGLANFNYSKAKEAMIATAKFDEFGKIPFGKNGFVSAGDEPESVSKTLEYAYDDFCIAQYLMVSKDTQDHELAKTYLKRSFNFVNLYDPQTKFMRGRRSGQWFSPFDPSEVNFNYTEANSWQYSLYAPHAVGVLRDLLGGKDSLEVWLDRLFTTESNLAGRHQVDITGLIGQYAHGNEPSHHMAYLYNYTNAQYKTQRMVRRILDEMYFNAPDGLSGNEDCGQMSSWFVLSSMGIYPIAPGSPYYEIGTTKNSESILQLNNGKSFCIKSINNDTYGNIIISMKLNGAPYNKLYLEHSDILEGGVLEITYGKLVRDSIPSFQHALTLSELPNDFVPVPYFEQEDRVFLDSLSVSLSVVNPSDYKIFYTTDGTAPTKSSQLYTTPININSNTVVKAITFNEYSHSSIIQNEFVKKDQGITLELHSEYANQYAAAGEYTLIDGIQGNNEYRTGDWQGYWAQDIITEVSFDEPRQLKEIGIGCLSDMKSWIFLPKSVIIEVSYDGESFEMLGEIKKNEESERDIPPHRMNFKLEVLDNKPIEKIRLSVQNPGKCPDWHLGAGNDTWMFVDEIILTNE